MAVGQTDRVAWIASKPAPTGWGETVLMPSST
ncbi:hypothetical protein PMI33_05321, partial [Pseudomonas sp. GM67]